MTIELIRANLEKSRNILQELNIMAATYSSSSEEGKIMIDKSARAMIDQLRIIHASISPLVKEMRIVAGRRVAFREVKKPRTYERVATATGPVYVSKQSKAKFLEDVGMSSKTLREVKLKIAKPREYEQKIIMAKPSFLTSISSSIFGPMASGLTKSSIYRSVDSDLKKANMPYMLSTYISMILFVTFLSFIVSLAVALAVSQGIFMTIIRNVAIALIVTVIVFFLMLSYPANVVRSNKRKIESELPFAASHMAAIASSKVEPSRIFTILAMTQEYKTFAAEIRKVVNQINVYGYDLTTALKNVSKATPSEKLGDLFNGMATTITTGGNLTSYLQEKAKSILLDYRFSRERYSTIIGMYSDIYTALLIAAPLIFMLLLAIMSVLGTTFIGLDIATLSNLGIAVIAVLNIAFIIFLNITQPEV
jgi:flagellar protein FlaJ